MNIEHLGEATIAQLVERGLVRDFADLYRLTAREMGRLAGFGRKSADNVVGAIAASRKRGLARVLTGLGIRLVADQVARLLAAHYGSLDRLAAAPVEELAAIRGVGPAIAESVAKFFADAGNRRLLDRLDAAGLTMTEPRVPAPGRGLAGKAFVLTGTLSDLTRDQAVDLLERRGARVTGAVSRKTDYVVVGDRPGEKREAARRLGVPTLSEGEFLAMVRGRAA
jgi:DNA ligase (NAD+)